MSNPLQRLQDAYNAFRDESEQNADREFRRAALEDAATVLQAIHDIENGFNRNRFNETQLEKVAADPSGNVNLRQS